MYLVRCTAFEQVVVYSHLNYQRTPFQGEKLLLVVHYKLKGNCCLGSPSWLSKTNTA